MGQDELRQLERKLASQLHHVREMIKRGVGSGEPDSTRSAIESGRCVKCGKPLGEDKNTSRGCHGSCAQAIRRDIRRGLYSDDDAVRSGWWAAPRVTGRPPLSPEPSPPAIDPSLDPAALDAEMAAMLARHTSRDAAPKRASRKKRDAQ